MSDEDDILKPIRDRIQSGKPLFHTVLGAPMKISLGAQGVVQIDAPAGIAGVQEAGIHRFVLAVPAGTLRAALEYLENKPDATVEVSAAQAAN